MELEGKLWKKSNENVDSMKWIFNFKKSKIGKKLIKV